MALKKRLKSDASLRPLVAQFVPLELDTEARAAEWQAWASKFKSEGNALPVVYVIRADGEVLYGKGGPIDELPKFLLGVRRQAGAALTAKQIKDLTTALEKAEKAHAEGDTAVAMREIGKFAAVTSFAEVAVKGKELATKLLDQGKEELKKAEDQFATSDEALAGAVSLLRILRVYQPFKELIKSAGQSRAKLQKEKKEVFAQAESLDAAAKLTETKAYDRAIKAYQAIISRGPDSPAAKLAQEGLERIEAAKKGEPAKKSADKEPAAKEAK